MTTTKHYTRQRIINQRALRQMAMDRFEVEQNKLLNKVLKFLLEY